MTKSKWPTKPHITASGMKIFRAAVRQGRISDLLDSHPIEGEITEDAEAACVIVIVTHSDQEALAVAALLESEERLKKCL